MGELDEIQEKNVFRQINVFFFLMFKKEYVTTSSGREHGKLINILALAGWPILGHLSETFVKYNSTFVNSTKNAREGSNHEMNGHQNQYFLQGPFDQPRCRCEKCGRKM